MHECTVCRYLGLEPRQTSSTVGVNTALGPLLGDALDRLSEGQHGEAHVVLPVCPEHVVDIYRDRLPGVSMAWKLASAVR